MASNSQFWKQEGNNHVKNGRYLKAIECYDTALTLTSTSSDACTLLLNRSHARLQHQAYDAALADAKAALQLPGGYKYPSTDNEKGLFRAAKACYGLRKFRESAEYLKILASGYPKNTAALAELERSKIRLREEDGEIDFADMLAEAERKFPNPDMDRADFVGPIEVRPCKNPEHGRGLFSTRAVKAGDLLLCEKAFCAAFTGDGGGEGGGDDVGEDGAVEGEDASEEEDGEGTTSAGKKRDLDDSKDNEKARLRAELHTKAFVKVCRNPSLRNDFMDLYPGPDAEEENDEETEVVEIDDAAVHNRILYNAFSFPLLSHTYHATTVQDPYSPSYFTSTSSIGLWLHASYINHSCYPLVRRSFLGDMMIFRAQCDIAEGEELKFGYISGMEPLAERKKMLGKYGFECGCGICIAEASTSRKKFKRRDSITKEIITLFEAEKPTGLHIYLAHLEALDATYIYPPSVEPRKAVVTPVMNILPELLRSRMYVQAVELVLLLLRQLGFVVAVTDTSFEVTRWGFMVDEIVMALADLCDAFRVVEPRLLADVEDVARKAYLIMCGEDGSWEAEYGRHGSNERQGEKEMGRVEDLVEGVEGMKVV